MICKALEKDMQWAGTGHAMPGLPSFQVTFKTAARVFCRLPVRAEDIPTLVEMGLWHRYASTDHSLRAAQLSNGTTSLLALLGDAAKPHYPSMEAIHKPQAWMTDRKIDSLRREIENMTDHPASVFSPRSPNYLLKGGCQKVYPGTPRVQLQDPAWQRELCIDTGDSDDTVVWHPGSRPLMGVSGRESQRFVCVEAASGSTAGLSLAPGEQAHLSLQAHRLN